MYYIQHIHYIKMKCQMLPFHPKSRTRSAFHSHHFHSTLHQEEKAKEVCKAKTVQQNTRAICPPPCAGVGTAGVKAMVCKMLTVKPNCASHVFFTIYICRKERQSVILTYGCYCNTSWSTVMMLVTRTASDPKGLKAPSLTRRDSPQCRCHRTPGRSETPLRLENLL